MIQCHTLKSSHPRPLPQSPKDCSIYTSVSLLLSRIQDYHYYLSKFHKYALVSISALLTMPKLLTVWITINCGKFWKRWEYQTTWPASWEKCLLIFTNSCLDLHSHLQWMQVLSTTSSPTDNIAWLFNCCQSGECEIMPHSSLKLQFLGHQRVWASLNIYLPFIVFFCEMLFMSFFLFGSFSLNDS